MTNMVRKQIYLEKRQAKAIQQKAEVLGFSESELIRQAIDRDLFGGTGIPNMPDPAVWETIQSFIQSRANQPLSGQPYQFNREELYEERSK